MRTPLLSICIPTYNRGEILKRSLESYVTNEDFDEDVEIVISDNASTDDTQTICEFYTSRYHNIKYYRNDQNVKDSNFCIALDRGTGRYLKLMNDNLIIEEEGLKYIKECVKNHLIDHKPLFFLNRQSFHCKGADIVECTSFEEYYKNVSFLVTAIMAFGAWKEDWDKVQDKLKCTKLKLNQDDWSYQIVERHNHCALYLHRYCHSVKLDSQRRTGYNWFEVHVTNYYSILQPYFDKNLVSSKVIKLEKTTYLWELRDPIVSKYLYNIQPDWNFDMSGATKILWKYFKGVPFFYGMMLSLPIWGSLKVLLYLKRKQFNHID